MKKGFTMVELIAVIVILGIITLIAVPVSSNIIKKSKEKMYDEQVKRLVEVTKIYAVENSVLPETGKKKVYINDLIKTNYLENEIINPITEEVMTGYILITNNNGKYTYEYMEELPSKTVKDAKFFVLLSSGQFAEINIFTKKGFKDDIHGEEIILEDINNESDLINLCKKYDIDYAKYNVNFNNIKSLGSIKFEIDMAFLYASDKTTIEYMSDYSDAALLVKISNPTFINEYKLLLDIYYKIIWSGIEHETFIKDDKILIINYFTEEYFSENNISEEYIGHIQEQLEFYNEMASLYLDVAEIFKNAETDEKILDACGELAKIYSPEVEEIPLDECKILKNDFTLLEF